MKGFEEYLIPPSLSLLEAMHRLDTTGRRILFVVDGEMRLVASLSDGDIRRWILTAGDLSVSVKQVMHANPVSVQQENLYSAKQIMRQNRVDALPLIDNDGKVRDIIFQTEVDEFLMGTKALKGVPVVLMAGGSGTRLQPYTRVLPKPLIPIGDTPIIERIIDTFYAQGAQDFYVSVNYHKNMIKAYFKELDHDYRMNFVEEDKPLGTAGSLALLRDSLTTDFILSNCDVIIRANYGGLYEHHMKSGNLITIVASLRPVVIPYGVIHVSNGVVTKLEEKPQTNYLINTGLYVVNPAVIDFIPLNCEFGMPELVRSVKQHSNKVGVYPVSENAFLDMGQFDEMERMKQHLSVEA